MDLKKLEKNDWIITIIVFLLVIIGTLIIFSTTYNTELATQGAGTLPRQIVFVIVGMLIYFGVAQIDIDWLKQPIILSIIYLITIGLLLYLKLFGQVIAETQRWIQIGFISIQPSEVAKITIIILTAYIFGIFKTKINKNLDWKNTNNEATNLSTRLRKFFLDNPLILQYIVSFALILPILVLVFLQPALGNSIILFSIWALTVFIPFPGQLKFVTFVILTALISAFLYNLFSISQLLGIGVTLGGKDIILAVIILIVVALSFVVVRLNYKYLITSLILGILIFPILNFGWNNILADYHRERIEVYIQGPEADQYGGGYQVIQSQIALGSGQLDGRGFLQGSQSALRVLDFAHTDFIFSSTGEQFGFIGSSIILLLYLILLLRIINVAIQSKSVFDSLLVAGVAVMILLNVFINVGMNMGILPVTGVPLPLISYGGSSIMVNLAGLGLVQAVKTNSKSIDISEKVLVVS